ncbi:hypothetical protein QLQ12_36055 [Actinoplanes sp. NEAU-A12]|uniref:Uncharacterized protein n=1 Tax=Actinoplanes sandaracinus TaxID=3045177 RepID=A0ABT6WW91_9ACTN|nr:hypothetical protein [Actinoplanes sandaracinus]MDI6104018.1 hypothetical protein [Actinoplanes sandaracinus]
MVHASRYYELDEPLSDDDIVELGGNAAKATEWNDHAQIRPEKAGGLGDGLACYRVVAARPRRCRTVIAVDGTTLRGARRRSW